MNDFYEQQLYLWRDLACELQEFIGYGLNLTPRQEAEYRDILKKYIEGEGEE